MSKLLVKKMTLLTGVNLNQSVKGLKRKRQISPEDSANRWSLNSNCNASLGLLTANPAGFELGRPPQWQERSQK